VVGFPAAVKDFVIDAISDINTEEVTWPFNHVTATQVLSTDGTQTYSFPSDFTTCDWESFFLNRDDNLTIPAIGTALRYVNYDFWRQKLRPRDVAMLAANYGPPQYIFQTQDGPNKFGVSPPSNQAYTLTYEYYNVPPDLVLYSDTPNIPPKYQSVIIDGATYYSYLFRDNAPEAKGMLEQFQAGIKQMRTELINRNEMMLNDVLPHGGQVARSFGWGYGY
jgi:hypothetical protein